MAKAHDLLLVAERPANVLVRALGLADLQQHAHNRLIGATVQWAFERSDRRNNRRVQVRQRRGGDPRRESRGVQAMVRVQDQTGVEYFSRLWIGLLAG